MGSSSKFYENSLADLAVGAPPLLDPSTKMLSPPVRSEINKTYQRLMGILKENERNYLQDDEASIYAGLSGYAFLNLFLADRERDEAVLQKASVLVERSLKNLNKRDLTFLCGDLGPLCIGAVTRHRLGNVRGAADCVAAVLNFLPDVLNLRSSLPDELLYGRVGYLYGLLFLQKHIPGSITHDHLRMVAEAIITHGRCEGPPPLMWSWYDEKYLGAAHGFAGILYLLLQVKELLRSDDLLLIQRTLDYMLSIRFPSGNLPSTIGCYDDKLVHWCHGAPGFVQLLLSAYEVWKRDEYLNAAEQCGEIVWQRGLLRKGYGICHGVAGNAYTFLALYQATRKELHLHRAVQFARWCATYNKQQDRSPDLPFSLFEGLAGTIYFLKDIQDPLQATFPAYSVQPFVQTQFTR